MGKSDALWRKVGTVAALAALSILIAEHFLPHGRDLDPVDHWLSEYALSDLYAARLLISLAFVALATSALSIAMLTRDRAVRLLFQVGSVALASMVLLDTDPNDHHLRLWHWPPSHGNLHQLALYVAIGATLGGIALHRRSSSRGRPRDAGTGAMLGVAVTATVFQTILVATSGPMTHFGGITERVVVLACLAWVLKTCRGVSPLQ